MKIIAKILYTIWAIWTILMAAFQNDPWTQIGFIVLGVILGALFYLFFINKTNLD